jgi:hypothetical protein
MRPLLAVVTVLSCVSLARAQGETLGIFQSDYDGKRYELRKRGDSGLDIYTQDGTVLLAAMSRQGGEEHFKGTTQTLATRCPGNAGKIETRGVSATQVRMRVEVAQEPLLMPGKKICNIRLGAAWQNFTLVQAAARVASVSESPVSGPSNQPPASSASIHQLQFTVTRAEAEGNVLTVTLSVLNQGTDRELRASFYVACGGAAEIIDDKGNTYSTGFVRIGNRDCGSDLLNGVTTQVTLTFRNLATTGGVLEASVIKRLTLPNIEIARRDRGTLEFRDIAISKNP